MNPRRSWNKAERPFKLLRLMFTYMYWDSIKSLDIWNDNWQKFYVRNWDKFIAYFTEVFKTSSIS